VYSSVLSTAEKGMS